MKILGIDPGYAIVGYGAISASPNNKFLPLCYGSILTESTAPFCDRCLKYLAI